VTRPIGDCAFRHEADTLQLPAISPNVAKVRYHNYYVVMLVTLIRCRTKPQHQQRSIQHASAITAA